MPVRGGKELARQFRELEEKVGRRVLNRAAKKGAEVILHRAEINAPTGRTWDLRKSLLVKRKKGEPGRVLFHIGFKLPEGHAAHLVEFGHRLVVRGKFIGHVPAHPFLRPAIEESRDRVLQVISAELRASIDRVTKRR